MGICEALLGFLRTHDIGVYWNILSQHGITRERLASYERKITEEPYYLPHTIHDFENYLVILKQLHCSTDLKMLCDEARRHFGASEHQACDQVTSNFGDSDKLRQIDRVTHFRHLLNQAQSNECRLRDFIFLDLALNSYVKYLSDSCQLAESF